MKRIMSIAAAMLLATPLVAQTAPTPTATPTPAATEAATKFDLDTPLETIAANPAAKAVLDTDLQNITAHPMYDQFKGMSLNQLQPVSQGQLTDAAMTKIKTDLAALKPAK